MTLPPKKLSYDNRYVTEVVQGTPSETEGVLPLDEQYYFPDNTTTVSLVWEINADEWQQVFNALMYGVDLAYPNRAIDTVEIFLRMVTNTVELCEAISLCIETNAATQQALQQALQQLGYPPGIGTPDTPSVYNANPLLADGSEITGCDNDNLFGAITQLVDLMNQVITDAFEGFESATALWEQINTAISGVPLVGELPIDEISEFAENLLSNISQNYNSSYTETIADQYRCDLFCLSKDTCEFSFEAWADYFLGLVGESISETDWTTSVNWFVTGNFLGDDISHAAHAILCLVLAYGARFFSIDMTWLSRKVTSFMNDPNPDWTTLCEDCNGWCVELSGSDFNARVFNGYNIGSQSGSDWIGSDWIDTSSPPRYRRSAQPVTVSTFTAALTRVEIDYSLTKGNIDVGTDTGIGFTVQTATAWTQSATIGSLSNGTNLTQVWTGNWNVVANKMEFVLLSGTYGNNSLGWSGSATIHRVRLYGNGTAPAIGTAC